MTPKSFAGFIVWDRTVSLIGFPDDHHASMHMLGTIQSAVIAAHVKPIDEGKWSDESAVVSRRAEFQFDYLGFRYELAGEYKAARIHIDSLEKIARVDEGCEFSDFYDDHMTIVVEDYRIKRLQENPDFGTW